MIKVRHNQIIFLLCLKHVQKDYGIYTARNGYNILSWLEQIIHCYNSSKMRRLYFIRHGESEFNKANKWTGSTDTPLTDTGHKQAKKAGKKLRDQGVVFDIIISSPSQR